jgi:steroid delta-isomerase-like uncharacterized protein
VHSESDCEVSIVDVKAFMERFFAEAINGRDVSRLAEFCAADYKWHGAENSEALGEVVGFDDYVTLCVAFFESFPDFHVDIKEILVDGDRACVRYVEGGTHAKEFAGFPATGRRATWSGIGIFHLREGRIHEEWLQSNMEARLAEMRDG